ncbi:hypothetical protein [Paracoccus tibetensis]|uniref:Uncharacterized protein n=1 Tax=Paracoccus tibetensis TaxID=336292 RepID=A0A1G5BTZ5_9RHOB|nr:hypothetical protein [Paracoccus tibetensis]SCX93524.1 hypothetical protein SAMN05660710_00273 [Paracoccus tibetensis]
MSDGFDQVMRLQSARATEWLRLRLEELPAPLTPDHPVLPALAEALGVARILSGLAGRPAPAELLLRRNLDAAVLRAASLAVLAGRGTACEQGIVAHGDSLAPSDPLHHLAAAALAADHAVPLHLRLAAAPGTGPVAEAEAALAAPLPVRVTLPDIAGRARLVAALWLGRSATARRRGGIRLHQRLEAEAGMATDLGCTETMALCALGLGALGDFVRLRDHAAALCARQAPDGSFTRRGDGPAEQSLAEGIGPTMAVLAALHLAVLRRWRAPSPAPHSARPLHDCLSLAAAAVARRVLAAPPEGWTRLRAAAVLGRASGADWFARLAPPRLALGRRQLARLSEIAFRDAMTALRLRRHLRDVPRGVAPRLDWLAGRPVTLQPLPAVLAWNWAQDAADGRTAAFLTGCRAVFGHTAPAPGARCTQMALRLAGAAYARATDDSVPLPAALAALERLILLAAVIEGEAPMRAAA